MLGLCCQYSSFRRRGQLSLSIAETHVWRNPATWRGSSSLQPRLGFLWMSPAPGNDPRARNHHWTRRNRDGTRSGGAELVFCPKRNKPSPLRSTTLRLPVSSEGKKGWAFLVCGVHTPLDPDEETGERQVWFETILSTFPPRALELRHSIRHHCRAEHHEGCHQALRPSICPMAGKNCQVHISRI